jgi:hypothetical protein
VKIFGASTPFKYALTSGMPDPPAAGEMKDVIADANNRSNKFEPAKTPNAVQYLHKEKFKGDM